MNLKVNFNRPIEGFDGKPQDGSNLSDSVVGLLSQEGCQDKEKIWKLRDWIQAIYKKQDLLLDKADLNSLQDIIVKSDRIVAFVKAQMLDVLDGAKEEKGKEKKLKPMGDPEPHPKDNPIHPKP